MNTSLSHNSPAAMTASIYPEKYKIAPPINNMGVTGIQNGQNRPIECDGTEIIALTKRGKKERFEYVRIPSMNSNVSERVGFVDQVAFTVRINEVISRDITQPYETIKKDKSKWYLLDAMPRLSSILLQIFGFGVTHQRERGINLYQKTYDLGEGYGTLSIGGQSETINVQITGKGAMMAKEGWQLKLFNYLTCIGHEGGWLTRIDLAADYYDGQYSPDKALEDFQAGKMQLNNKRPFAECRGDWFNEEGGKTFYVGKRTSGKLMRVYEKFKEIMGVKALRDIDGNHPLNSYKKWVRIEVEWHNKNRIMPLEMLINPGQFLAGAYPALGFLSEVQNIVETTKKKVVATVERAVQIAKQQFGAWIYALIQVKGVGVLKEIIREDVPKWAKQYDVPPALDDDQWESWEKEMAAIPF
jgi:phage replication initiation protein